jgi:GSH-dependent disulfide-bond oxidoreductase
MENSPAIVLYGMKTGNCIRAAMALEEAETPYAVRRYDPRAPGDGEAEFRRLNFTGKVPTLVDRSRPGEPFVLTQSNAIVLHAAAKAPEKLLHSGDARAEARVLERYFYFVTDVIVPSHAALFVRTQGIPAAAKLLVDRSMAAIEDAERFASAGAFIAGDAFSIADIAAVTIVASVADELPWDRLPALSRWFGVVKAHPSFHKAAVAFDE